MKSIEVGDDEGEKEEDGEQGVGVQKERYIHE